MLCVPRCAVLCCTCDSAAPCICCLRTRAGCLSGGTSLAAQAPQPGPLLGPAPLWSCKCSGQQCVPLWLRAGLQQQLGLGVEGNMGVGAEATHCHHSWPRGSRTPDSSVLLGLYLVSVNGGTPAAAVAAAAPSGVGRTLCCLVVLWCCCCLSPYSVMGTVGREVGGGSHGSSGGYGGVLDWVTAVQGCLIGK
jgi:hypothetical protein